MIKVVVFDLDGTLVDSMKMIFEALNDALSKRDLPAIELNLLGQVAGRPLRNIVLTKTYVAESAIQAIEKDVFEAYMQFCRTSCQLLPNVEKTLKTLKSRGMKLGLFTTTPRKPLEVVVEKLALDDYFDVMLAKEDVRNKPDPDGLEQIIRRLGVIKDECLYVGDSPIDVLTGKAAGIRTIAIPTGATTMEQLRENKPDIIINNMIQLLKYVD